MITRRMRPADAWAFVVGAVGLGIYLAVAQVAYLRGDDWILLSIVSSPDFGPQDIFRPYGNHLMPYGLFAFWAAVAVFGPAPWWPLVIVGAAIAAVAMYFHMAHHPAAGGARPASGRPVRGGGPRAGRTCSSHVAIAGGVPDAAVGLFGRSAVRVRAGPVARGSWTYWVLLCIGLGLLAVETALLLVPLLFIVSAAWFERGGPVRSVVGAWNGARSLWLAAGALIAIYGAFYFTSSSYAQTLPGQRAGTDLIVEGSLVALGTVGPSMMLAGPWSWSSSMAPAIDAAAPVVAVTLLIAALVVVRGRRAGWRAWIPFLALLLLTVAALSAARLAVFGTSVLLNPYYYVAGLTVLAVTLAVAFLPSKLPIDGERTPPPRVAFMGAGVLLLLSATVAAVTYAAAVPRAPGRAYLQAAEDALREPTLNAAAPREVFGVFLYGPPFDSAENTLALAGVQGDWVDAAEDAHILDGFGRRVPVAVTGPAFDLPGGCLPIDSAVVLTMPDTRQPNRPTYRMHYVAGQDTTARVRIGQEELTFPLRAGDQRVYFSATGVPDSLSISAPDTCLLGLVVGEAKPRT